MILSQSYALAGPPPAEIDVRTPLCLAATMDIVTRGGGQDFNPPIELDFRSPAGFAQLRRMDLFWPNLSETARHSWLRNLDIILPPRDLSREDIALLPGGAVAVRDSNSILVCDPSEAIAFDETESKRFRNVLGSRTDVVTLSHTAKGVVLCQRVPALLPPQAVSIVPDATKLPIRIGLTGPVLIQWGVRGAVAWPLVVAPAAFALAASIAASPLIRSGSGLARNGSAVAPELWCAEYAEARSRLIAPALAEHAGEVIGDTVGDDLLLALMDACVEGNECLARRIATGLAILPSCFMEDPNAIPGARSAVWQHEIAHIRGSADNLVLLGLDNMFAPATTIRALRDVIEDAEVLDFDENGDALPGNSAPLHSDAAMFLARHSEERGRLGLAVPAPATPVDLYVMAHDVAAVTGGRVIAVSLGWGFCHRIGPEGEESGNAGWFGLGASLDEMDVLVADIQCRA